MFDALKDTPAWWETMMNRLDAIKEIIIPPAKIEEACPWNLVYRGKSMWDIHYKDRIFKFNENTGDTYNELNEYLGKWDEYKLQLLQGPNGMWR